MMNLKIFYEEVKQLENRKIAKEQVLLESMKTFSKLRGTLTNSQLSLDILLNYGIVEYIKYKRYLGRLQNCVVKAYKEEY
ncbi:hypothetical protein TwortDSMZ_172 [Staphylococcus phage Twort]|uniref:Uncharacterized protein n=2 Tax=Staphylococcus phage Twort (strain DSM 17442 / HER 48) TaxID=2908167 RepID=A0A6H0X5G9_BPTWO|nr:ORF157 [Staphylococcus phage Twort]AAX92435.1 ORF157 [Staphylococcus phage Twort]QIW89170.1 hypothetical protein TwortDSMZ_172 [Staphylococcus phage Twort]